jgi:endonuclease/exonuclease/phosphatase family metal-dependent hydrolase
MRLRVLTWNLMHGRTVPPSGRELFDPFAAALERWEWEVALLQEVPPWWAGLLGVRLDAEHTEVLTSRNGLLAVRRAIATRWPDLIKSNGGGANAILLRKDRVIEHRTLRLCRLPERRWVHAARLACGVWVANLHASAHSPAAALRDARLAAHATLEWAAGEPLVLGGDFNMRALSLDGLSHAAGHTVDHVFAADLRINGTAEVLQRGPLSDHAPVAVTLERRIYD